MSSPIAVRAATADDMRFIAASWFESYWKATANQEMTFTVYKPGQDALIRRLAQRSDIIVAHAREVEDEILGYAVLEEDVLHYVYVKSVYRRHGIAKGLIRARAKRYSCKTRLGKRIVESMDLTFDPYAAY